MSEETTHRGVPWRRDGEGRISFFDEDADRWVRWSRGADSPPLPPGWEPAAPRRARWYTGWRLVPVALAVLIVALAIYQVSAPSASEARKEAAAAQALLGKCLAQNGTLLGHPRYSATPVPCGSPKAAAKVVEVLGSAPGSPLCPGGTVGMELAYPGVRYPHVECLEPLQSGR